MKYYEIDFKVTAPSEFMQDSCDLIAALSGEAGLETFEETESGLRGYAQQSLFDDNTLKAVLCDFPFPDVKIEYTVSEAEDKDWNEEWETTGFEPITISNRCVIHDGRHLPEGNYDISVEIDAKLAFGTGTHETTRMVASMILDSNPCGKSLLDCGCGTGILGIVALKAGADNVVGYDIDDWSTNNTMHNAIINLVDDKYAVMLGNSDVLSGIDLSFDIVAANINRNILLADIPQFRKKMKAGSILIMSGFYIEDAPSVIEKAKEYGMELVTTISENNWACVKLAVNS